MNNELLALFIGIGIRFGIPVVLTLLAVLALRRLDKEWLSQAQARRSQQVSAGLTPRNTGCWNVMNCSEEKRATCKAFASQDLPCWQVYRSKDGELQERCRACSLFKSAPLPVRA